jgi:hypothetical protein
MVVNNFADVSKVHAAYPEDEAMYFRNAGNIVHNHTL